MANLCDNDFYFYSENKDNLEYVWNFINEYFEHSCEIYDNTVEGWFSSKWTFPEELMEEMFNNLPCKDDVQARCLSVEYGCLYHALWTCDEDGWIER